MSNQASSFISTPPQLPFLLRAIWYFVIGWWLSGVFIAVGYVCIATIVFAPVGFWFLNRVPQAQTLRTNNRDLIVTGADGVSFITPAKPQQVPWPIRLIYLPFGLVMGAIWLFMAWVFGLLLITLPLSVWMINRSAAVITLERH